MKRNVGGFLVSLALGGLSYNWGHSRSEAHTIHADEISKWASEWERATLPGQACSIRERLRDNRFVVVVRRMQSTQRNQ